MRNFVNIVLVLLVAYLLLSPAIKEGSDKEEKLANREAISEKAKEESKESKNLNISQGIKEITIEVDGKPFVLNRKMTSCAKNTGYLQPLVPVEGVVPVTEMEIINALANKEKVLDMRMTSNYLDGTIPGSVSMPYMEVAQRLNELGCEGTEGNYNCEEAVKVYAFCNGPVCPQSPIAIKAMVREGFPPEKIYYYRGGMLDWDALGFPVVEGKF